MEPLALLAAGVLGLCFGSFVTLASYRLPRGEDVCVEPSRCTSCRKALRPCDLVPVLSWMGMRGKCRRCGARIHWRYPAIELVTGALFVLLFARYGLSWQTALLLLFTVALMVMVVVDFEHYLIPDEVHLALLPLGLAYRLLLGAPWQEIGGGLALGLGLGLLLRYGYQWWRGKEGLGMGDVKFLAVVGLWLGILPLVPFLFFSGLLGVATALVWRAMGRGALFPFGPALAASLFICVAFPEVAEGFWNMQRWMYR